MKLAYIVTEQGCMDPTTGAFQHISMGIRELGKHTGLVQFLPSSPSRGVPNPPVQGQVSKVKGFRNTTIWGAIRDLRDLARNMRYGWRIAHKVKAAGCQAAYVRVQCLQPISIFLMLLGVKVFLEANGLQFQSRQSRFKSLFTCLYEPFERFIYTKADHVFFVGSYGQYWQLSSQNWTDVENGIECEMLQGRAHLPCADKPLKIVLLARLVDHHKGSLLVDAIKGTSLSVQNNIELHLVGSGFEQIKADLKLLVNVVDHGFVGRSCVGDLLRSMDIGVIPDCPPYGSQMKLLDYAAAGCLVLAPDVPHLVNFYSDRGVCFFEVGNASAMAVVISSIVSGRVDVEECAQMLQSHVREHYTWEAIFCSKWNEMEALLAEE